MEEKKKTKIFTKWWFWLIALLIVIVVGITIIMVVALNIVTGGINEVALKIQKIDNEATVYKSAGDNIIVVEIPNYSDEIKKNKTEQIKTLIKSYAQKDGILANYSTAMICSKINSEKGDKNYFLSINAYTLPDLKEDLNNSSLYIDFIKYTENSVKNSSNEVEEEIKGEDITLATGKYTVGTDLKEGKYDVVAQSGSGNFFVKGSTNVNEILTTNEKEKTNYGWIDKYNNLTLKKGDTIELRSGLTILLQAK